MSTAIDRRQRRRRKTWPVAIGRQLIIGGESPLVVQSMCTTPTADTAATLAQAVTLGEAGCQLVRVTVPTVADAVALAPLRRSLDSAGFRDLPLCADIHFQPRAALVALEHVEKVRINPGNYAGAGRTARDADDTAPLLDRLAPLFNRARELGRAIRIGVNHGSLAERILRHHGNTPRGMVVSALECTAAAEAADFRSVVISLKASDPRIMVRAYRLLVEELERLDLRYPLHLGVTEAGAGSDGRIRSAAGIGALLADGIGDTIRVSLTEDPVAEIPVAQALAARFLAPSAAADRIPATVDESVDPLDPRRRSTAPIVLATTVGGNAPVAVCDDDADARADLPSCRFAIGNEPGIVCIDLPADDPTSCLRNRLSRLPPGQVPTLGRLGGLSLVHAYRLLAALLDAAGEGSRPLCLAALDEGDPLVLAADIGGLLMDGIGDAVYLPAAADPVGTALAILQATKLRLTRADIITCPGCGRTQFNLIALAEEVRHRLGHLPGLGIGVMGCIVNGPGEMAGTDYGVVGAGAGLVDCYRAGKAVRRNIPLETACDVLIALIQADGRWRDA